MYCKIKKTENLANQYLYWLEKSLINTIRRNIITILLEQYNNLNCSYNKENNYNDHIINQLYLIMNDITFNSYEEVKAFLLDDNIKKIIHKID